MSEPIITTIASTTAVKSGVATGVFVTAAIFSDPAYAWMSIIGAAVGIISMAHTLFGKGNKLKLTRVQISLEIFKAFVLGVGAMPLLFLLISQGVFEKFLGIAPGEVSLSVALVLAFVLSWYFVPILDAVAGRLIRKAGNDKV